MEESIHGKNNQLVSNGGLLKKLAFKMILNRFRKSISLLMFLDEQ